MVTRSMLHDKTTGRLQGGVPLSLLLGGGRGGDHCHGIGGCSCCCRGCCREARSEVGRGTTTTTTGTFRWRGIAKSTASAGRSWTGLNKRCQNLACCTKRRANTQRPTLRLTAVDHVQTFTDHREKGCTYPNCGAHECEALEAERRSMMRHVSNIPQPHFKGIIANRWQAGGVLTYCRDENTVRKDPNTPPQKKTVSTRRTVGKKEAARARGEREREDNIEERQSLPHNISALPNKNTSLHDSAVFAIHRKEALDLPSISEHLQPTTHSHSRSRLLPTRYHDGASLITLSFHACRTSVPRPRCWPRHLQTPLNHPNLPRHTEEGRARPPCLGIGPIQIQDGEKHEINNRHDIGSVGHGLD